MRKPYRKIVFVALLSLAAGCKEKSSGAKEAGTAGPAIQCDPAKDPSCEPGQASSNPTNQNNPQGAALADVCGGITQNASLGEFALLTGLLCANGTSGLVQQVAGLLYTGSGASTVRELSSEELANKQSKVRLISAMRLSNIKPLSYFNFMKLQVGQPTQFKSAGFETDPNVTYEVKNAQANLVSYRYKNVAESDAVVDYYANAKFITVIPDKVYLVTTSLDTTAANETVVALKGFSLIFASSTTSTDIVSVSDQTYDNYGNHGPTTSKAKKAAQNEQIRSFANGMNADRANALVK